MFPETFLLQHSCVTLVFIYWSSPDGCVLLVLVCWSVILVRTSCCLQHQQLKFLIELMTPPDYITHEPQLVDRDRTS